MPPEENPKENPMTVIRYTIVEHDGGWAYQLDGAFSESFPTHKAALRRQDRGH